MVAWHLKVIYMYIYIIYSQGDLFRPTQQSGGEKQEIASGGKGNKLDSYIFSRYWVR